MINAFIRLKDKPKLVYLALGIWAIIVAFNSSIEHFFNNNTFFDTSGIVGFIVICLVGGVYLISKYEK